MENRNVIILVLVVLALVGVFVYSSKDDEHVKSELTNTSEEHHEDEDVKSYEIYPGDLVEKINDGEDIILLDVRTLAEYEEIHLENALLLPVQELSQKSLSEIGLGEFAKDKEIVIYCRSGNRSKTAYDIMDSLGYTNIKSVSGGMIHWEEDEYPLTEVGEYVSPKMSKEVSSTEGPVIAIDRELHSFGVIPQYGGTVEADFTITNQGSQNLEIGTLTTSCSCTSAKISNSSIEPGGEATLTVVFDPDFHEEPLDVFKRTVFIPTNDPNNPEAEIAIEVDIAEGQ